MFKRRLLFLILFILPIVSYGQKFDDYTKSNLENVLTFDVQTNNNWLFFSPEKASIKVTVKNNGTKSLTSEVKLNLSTDKSISIKDYSKKIRLKGGDSSLVSFDFRLKPGFYRITLSIPGGKVKKFNIGYEPEKIVSPYDAQPDIDEFWERAKKELASVSPDYELTLLPEKSTNTNNIYLVKMKSLGGETIAGYYSEPVAKGVYPAIINYMGYGGQAWCPGGNPEFAEFVLSTRGQGLNQVTNKYGDWITYSLDDLNNYYYRGAYMDLIRGLDFLTSREKVDKELIFAQGGSQGGAFTLAACALDDRIRAGAPDVPFLSDFPDYFQIVPWPSSAVLAAQKRLNISDKELYSTLSYFDIKNLTGRIKCPILMAFGLQDEVCPPHKNFAAYNNIKSEKKYMVFPNRGHDVWNETDWGVKRWEFIMSFIPKK